MDFPPEGEMMAFFARAYTSWEPPSRMNLTEEEVEREHRASLERRWNSGQAMSPKQILEAFGGGRVGIDSDGIFRDAQGNPIPGSHPFPGMKSHA